MRIKNKLYIMSIAVLLSPQLSVAGTTWYGHVNRVAFAADDGHAKNTFFADNDASGTRFGVAGDVDVQECLMIGGKFELGLVAANSASVNQLDGSGSDSFSIRHADTWLKTSFGTISVGKGSMATDGTAEVSFSDTWNTSYSAVSVVGGGLYFHDKSSNSKVVSTDPTVGTYFNNYDGLGRKNRARYTSPDFAGVVVSASVGRINNEQYGSDVALTYNSDKTKEILFGGALGYYKFSKNGNSKAEKVLDGSAGVLHNGTGLNASVAFAKRKRLNDGDKNHRYGYVQVGKKSDLNSYGKTNFAVDYFNGKNAVANNDKATSYGAGVAQKFDSVNAEVYMGLRNYKLKNSTATYNNVLTAMLGIKIGFGGTVA
ncbi:MAG: porin [Francisellaceae bacterium]|jgi:hypothetical protein|nr:porin [Francisellaceae bacterium]MBT6538694.1 porin [Francisellaceae bacterium]